MKFANIFIGISTVVVLSVSVNARTIRDFFISDSSNVFELIDPNTRLDLLDYFDEGKLISTRNNLGDGTQLVSVTPNFISINTTKSSNIEMYLLTEGKDSLIILNTTLKLPASEGKISIYNKDWEKIDTKKHFKHPKIADFIKKTATKSQIQSINETVDFPIISYTINPANGNITATQNMAQYMSKDDYAKISPYLTDSISYQLKGKKYTLLKGK